MVQHRGVSFRMDGQLEPPRRKRVIGVSTDGRPFIRVQTLGASRFLVGDRVIGVQSEIIFAILLRLAYAPSMGVPRDTLLSELWPGEPGSRQRANLRQALYKLRSMRVEVSLCGDVVQLERKQVAPTFPMARNLESFDRDITHGDEPFGLFVPGIVPCGPAHADWLEGTRDAVHGDIRRVLVEALRLRRERADWTAAGALSRWLLQFDPLNEDATLTLAECAVLNGSKADAVATLDRYLAELGPEAGDIRLPAQMLRRRFTEPSGRRRPSHAAIERHFFGREEELAELTMSMRRARWHDGSAYLLHGPPGIGKSRLVAELAKVAQIEGYREVTAECREADMQRPLSVFVDVLPELLSTPGALGSSPESLAVLRKLVGLEAAADERQTGLQPTHAVAAVLAADMIDDTLRTIRAQSIRHAILDLLAAISDEKPLLLCIENLQWMDATSWEMLSDIIHRIRDTRIFFVATSRCEVLCRAGSTRTIGMYPQRIQPLAHDSCVQLARALCTDFAASPTPEIEAWLVDSSEGTPLLLRALVDHWVTTAEFGGVPPSIAALIKQRLDGLTNEALRTLQTIELLGRNASLDRINEILQLPIHALLQALDNLEATDCLATVCISHLACRSLVGSMARSRMTPLTEATLRGAIADALESEYKRTGDGSLMIESLRHLELGNRIEALTRFVLRNEEALLQSGHPAPVLSAVRLLSSHEQTPQIAEHLTHIQSRLDLEVGAFGAALQATLGATFLPRNVVNMSNREIDQALTYVESAYRSDPAIDRSSLGAFVAAIAGHEPIPIESRIRAADIGLVIASNTCDTVLADACYHGIVPSEVQLQSDQKYQHLGLIYHSVFGSVDTAYSIALSMYQRAIAAPITTNSITDCSRSGYVFRLAGRHELAEKSLAHAINAATELASPRRKEYPLWQLALLALDAGDIARAIYWTDMLTEIALANDEDTANDYLFGHLCMLAIAKSKEDEAEENLRRCLRALPSLPPVRSTAFTVGLELGTRLLDPTWRPSLDILDVAIDRFHVTATRCAADYLASVICECLLRLQRLDQANSLMMTYIRHERRERSPLPYPLAETIARPNSVVE